MDHALERSLRTTAEAQHGVVSRRQAHALGASRDHLRRRLASPAWEAPSSQVLRLVGCPGTFEQRCMAGVLDAGRGATLSHGAAAALWKIPGFGPGAVEVSRPRGGTRRGSSLTLVHEPGPLPPHHVTRLQSIPVTVVARTLFDLAAILPAGRLERALDNCLARGLTTTRALHAVTSELAEHGRTGSALMRASLAVRDSDYVAPASGLEARFLWLLRREGIREPVRQLDVGADAWVGRVDLAYPDRKVVVEVDSDLHHTSRLDRQADARRDTALRAAGFQVVRVTAEQVWHRPDEAVGMVRAALRRPAACAVPPPEASRRLRRPAA